MGHSARRTRTDKDTVAFSFSEPTPYSHLVAAFNRETPNIRDVAGFSYETPSSIITSSAGIVLRSCHVGDRWAGPRSS